MKALSELRILDMTVMLSGPYASMLLADMGAEVIKVEPPGTGDMTRSIQRDTPYEIAGLSSYFMTLGRNKRSIVLDLRTEQGRAVLYDLVRKADVVVDNFRPGVLERLGADYETLKKINPQIITCSITAYGLTGPGKDRAAYDACIQAYSGGMSITGIPDGEPMRAGIPYGDLCSGMAGAMGILGAVVARSRTGIGQQVEVSMLDVQLSLWNYMATMHLITGLPASRLGNQHFTHVPYNTYAASDSHLFLAIVPEAHWLSLLQVLDRMATNHEVATELSILHRDEFLTRNGRIAARAQINTSMGRIIATRKREEWLEGFIDAGLPCAPVNDVEQAFTDPQAIARNMVVDVEHPLGGTMKQPGNPIKMSEADPDQFTPPPLLGQHTTEILTGLLGYSTDMVEELLAGGITEQPSAQDITKT